MALLAKKLLILFDDQNIEIHKLSKKKIKRLAKNVDESETWIDSLQDEKCMDIL